MKKLVIRNLEKGEAYSSFKDNIWGADIADKQLMVMYNNRFHSLLCIIDIVSKYAWVVPLKDKNVITVINAFLKILDESNGKPNKVWVDKSSNVFVYKRKFSTFLKKGKRSQYVIAWKSRRRFKTEFYLLSYNELDAK